MEIKVGDKVKIRVDLDPGARMNEIVESPIVDEMLEYRGRYTRVSRIDSDGDLTLEIDDGNWSWDPSYVILLDEYLMEIPPEIPEGKPIEERRKEESMIEKMARLGAEVTVEEQRGLRVGDKVKIVPDLSLDNDYGVNLTAGMVAMRGRIAVVTGGWDMYSYIDIDGGEYVWSRDTLVLVSGFEEAMEHLDGIERKQILKEELHKLLDVILEKYLED